MGSMINEVEFNIQSPSMICHSYFFLTLMSLIAHQFGHVEFGIWNTCNCFLQAGAVEKLKTNIRNLKFDTSKSMSYQEHKYVL